MNSRFFDSLQILVDRVPGPVATFGMIGSGVAGWSVYVEKATTLIAFLTAVLACLGAAAGAAYWVAKAVLAWRKLRSGKPDND